MNARRIESKPSNTAEYTCFSRGCATREKDARFRGPDTMAEALFPLKARAMLNIAPVRKMIMSRMFPPGMHEYLIARTKVMDAAYLDALERGFDQIVILGAGYDTRALRFAGRNSGTRIFEVDADPTQQAKLGMLRRRKLEIPAELTFVPVNFDKEDLQQALTRSGYQEGKENLFLWEGVTMYLTAEAVDMTLAFIQATSTAGSRVVFDYVYAGVLRREHRYYGETDGFDMVAKVGESWTFGLEEGEIEGFLKKRGLKLTAHYASSDLERCFFTEPDGKLHARVNGTHCLAEAEVK